MLGIGRSLGALLALRRAELPDEGVRSSWIKDRIVVQRSADLAAATQTLFKEARSESSDGRTYGMRRVKMWAEGRFGALVEPFEQWMASHRNSPTMTLVEDLPLGVVLDAESVVADLPVFTRISKFVNLRRVNEDFLNDRAKAVIVEQLRCVYRYKPAVAANFVDAVLEHGKVSFHAGKWNLRVMQDIRRSLDAVLRSLHPSEPEPEWFISAAERALAVPSQGPALATTSRSVQPKPGSTVQQRSSPGTPSRGLANIGQLRRGGHGSSGRGGAVVHDDGATVARPGAPDLGRTPATGAKGGRPEPSTRPMLEFKDVLSGTSEDEFGSVDTSDSQVDIDARTRSTFPAAHPSSPVQPLPSASSVPKNPRRRVMGRVSHRKGDNLPNSDENRPAPARRTPSPPADGENVPQSVWQTTMRGRLELEDDLSSGYGSTDNEGDGESEGSSSSETDSVDRPVDHPVPRSPSSVQEELDRREMSSPAWADALGLRPLRRGAGSAAQGRPPSFEGEPVYHAPFRHHFGQSALERIDELISAEDASMSTGTGLPERIFLELVGKLVTQYEIVIDAGSVHARRQERAKLETIATFYGSHSVEDSLWGEEQALREQMFALGAKLDRLLDEIDAHPPSLPVLNAMTPIGYVPNRPSLHQVERTTTFERTWTEVRTALLDVAERDAPTRVELKEDLVKDGATWLSDRPTTTRQAIVGAVLTMPRQRGNLTLEDNRKRLAIVRDLRGVFDPDGRLLPKKDGHDGLAPLVKTCALLRRQGNEAERIVRACQAVDRSSLSPDPSDVNPSAPSLANRDLVELVLRYNTLDDAIHLPVPIDEAVELICDWSLRYDAIAEGEMPLVEGASTIERIRRGELLARNCVLNTQEYRRRSVKYKVQTAKDIADCLDGLGCSPSTDLSLDCDRPEGTPAQTVILALDETLTRLASKGDVPRCTLAGTGWAAAVGTGVACLIEGVAWMRRNDNRAPAAVREWLEDGFEAEGFALGSSRTSVWLEAAEREAISHVRTLRARVDEACDAHHFEPEPVPFPNEPDARLSLGLPLSETLDFVCELARAFDDLVAVPSAELLRIKLESLRLWAYLESQPRPAFTVQSDEYVARTAWATYSRRLDELSHEAVLLRRRDLVRSAPSNGGRPWDDALRTGTRTEARYRRVAKNVLTAALTIPNRCLPQIYVSSSPGTAAEILTSAVVKAHFGREYARRYLEASFNSSGVRVNARLDAIEGKGSLPTLIGIVQDLEAALIKEGMHFHADDQAEFEQREEEERLREADEEMMADEFAI